MPLIRDLGIAGPHDKISLQICIGVIQKSILGPCLGGGGEIGRNVALQAWRDPLAQHVNPQQALRLWSPSLAQAISSGYKRCSAVLEPIRVKTTNGRKHKN